MVKLWVNYVNHASTINLYTLVEEFFPTKGGIIPIEPNLKQIASTSFFSRRSCHGHINLILAAKEKGEDEKGIEGGWRRNG